MADLLYCFSLISTHLSPHLVSISIQLKTFNFYFISLPINVMVCPLIFPGLPLSHVILIILLGFLALILIILLGFLALILF